MYLVSIQVENLRAIRHMSLDFLRPPGLPEDVAAADDYEGQTIGRRAARRWTVLLGENGCGKSTVLKAIGLALAGSEALHELLGNPSDWVRNGADQASIRLTVRTAENEERVIRLTIVRGDRIDSVIKRNSEGLALLDAALEHSNLNYFVAGYGAFRRPPDPDQEQGWSRRHRLRASSLNTLFAGNGGLIGMDQWARRHDYQKGPEGRKIIADALNKLLPGMTFERIDKESGQLVLKTEDGLVPLRQLSEGYQAMAAWAGDLLYRMSESFTNYNNPLSARGVLLIDEMDLHLHPVWKRRLVEFINDAFPKLQIVATTHSPLSIQQCGEGELFVVRRDDKQGPVLVSFKGDPSKMRLSELFLSPLVGLPTLDSPRVADLRDVAREIELRPGVPSKGEGAVLTEIAQQLEGTVSIATAEIPGFERYSAQMSELRKLDPLARIAASNELFGSGLAPGASSRKPPVARVAASTVTKPRPRLSMYGQSVGPVMRAARKAAKKAAKKTTRATAKKGAKKSAVSSARKTPMKGAAKKASAVKKTVAPKKKAPAKRLARKSAKFKA
jgi:hypothetical protein